MRIIGQLYVRDLQLIAMPTCEYCGESTTNLTYRCSYCDKTLCQSHRIPETHDCVEVANTHPPTSVGQTADAIVNFSRGAHEDLDLSELRERAEAEAEGEPYSVAKIEHTVGTQPEPDYEPTPDVAIDGSVKREGETVEATESTKSADNSRGLLPIILTVVIVATAVIAVIFII